MIGRNWLLRAQKSLANVARVEGGSSSSEGSTLRSERQTMGSRVIAEDEMRLHAADYVEARGLLLPATEYFQRAVTAAKAQGIVTGILLSAVCSPCPAILPIR